VAGRRGARRGRAALGQSAAARRARAPRLVRSSRRAANWITRERFCFIQFADSPAFSSARTHTSSPLCCVHSPYILLRYPRPDVWRVCLSALCNRSLLWSLPAIVFVYSAAGCQVTPQITSFVRQTLIPFDEISAPLSKQPFPQIMLDQKH
jgi:hypothetical protein